MVLGALLLALAARRRLRSGTMPTRLAGIEAGILVAVLGLSAAITTKAPPADADAALPFAPPAVGPAFVAGARAGWVGVGATASTGQLVVRLDAPTPELEKAGRFSLSGNVDLDGSPTKLEFRACGQECFVAPVDWTPGIHVVTLGVGLEGSLPGGATALRIAWPADSRPALLRRVVRAMRAVPDLTLHEQVTSRAGEFPQSSVVHISGPFLLDSDPYGSGRATTVDLVERNGGETTIALAYPGSGVYIELTVDRQFRIVREAEYSPHFLVARTMVYPDGDEDGG